MDRGFECTWSHICNFSRLLYFGFIQSQFFRKRITPQKSFTRMLKMALHVVASKGVKKMMFYFRGSSTFIAFYLHLAPHAFRYGTLDLPCTFMKN